MLLRLSCGAAVGAGLLLVAPSARADASAAEMAAARALSVEGIKLANAGKCGDAIDRLERAEKLFHAPTTLGRLGECYVELGKLVLGTEDLRRVVREPLAANAPQAFVKARARAEKVLAAAQPRIPFLRLVVTAPAGVKPEVTLDGEPLSSAAIGTDLPVDPGERTIEASAPGYLKERTQVSFKEAERREITLTLTVDPNAPKPTPTTTPVAGAGTEPARGGGTATTSSSSASRAPAYLAFAVGGAGVAVGSVAGIVFLKHASDLQTSCPDKKCPPDRSGDLGTTKTWGTISTIGFAVGAVGVAAGVVLLVTAGSSTESERRGAVTPVVGPAYAGIRGRF